MNEPTRIFLSKHFLPNRTWNNLGMNRGWYITESSNDYVARVLPIMTTFNVSLTTPPNEPWTIVLIQSLQTIHAYPTQTVNANILNEFHRWCQENPLEPSFL